MALGAVIGAHVQMVADRRHLPTQNQQVGRLGTDDNVDLGAPLVQVFRLWIDRRGAQPARHEQVAAALERLVGHLHEIGGAAQRADHVDQRLPGFQGADHPAGGADNLGDDGDGPAITVVVANGQGNPFPLFPGPYDQELARQCGRGDARRLHLHQTDGGRQHFFPEYLIHSFRCFLCFFVCFSADGAPRAPGIRRGWPRWPPPGVRGRPARRAPRPSRPGWPWSG